jgi:hypothetical protein
MLLAHLSDLHLGRTSAPHGAERLNSFRQALVTLSTHNPATIVIAGDMFEGPHVDSAIVEEAAKSLSAARNERGDAIPVVLIPGNHDPADAQRLWTTFQKAIEPGCDLRLALTPQVFELAAGQLVIEAYPCMTRFSAESPWEKRLPVSPKSSAVRVVVAHGTLLGGPVPEDEGDAYPFTQADVEALGADYLALGHFHGVYPPWPGGDECERGFSYCGTHEPDQFDSDAGYAILATLGPIGAHRARLQRIKVGKRQWRLVSVAGPGDLGKLEALRAEVQADSDPERFVIRLKVTDSGWTASEIEQLDRLEGALRARCPLVECRGDVQVRVDAEALDLNGLPCGAVKEALLSLQNERGQAPDAMRRELVAAAIQIGWEKLRDVEES